MTACNQEQRLTPFLLGDLPAAEADACRRHLAQCAACRQAARELEPVVAALRTALRQDAASDLRLDPPRRAQLLAVPPTPASVLHHLPARRFGSRVILWAARPRAWLAMAASLIVVIGVVVFLVPRFMTAHCRLPNAQYEMLGLDTVEPAGAVKGSSSYFSGAVGGKPEALTAVYYGELQKSAAKPAAPAPSAHPSAKAPAIAAPESAHAALPAPSPDGNELAYHWHRVERGLPTLDPKDIGREGAMAGVARMALAGGELDGGRTFSEDGDQKQNMDAYQPQPAAKGLPSPSKPEGQTRFSQLADRAQEQLGDIAGKDGLRNWMAAPAGPSDRRVAQSPPDSQARDKAQLFFDLGRTTRSGDAVGSGGGSGGAAEGLSLGSSSPALVAGDALEPTDRFEAMTSNRKTESAGDVGVTIRSDESRAVAASQESGSSFGVSRAGAVAGKRDGRTAGEEGAKRKIQEHRLQPQADKLQRAEAISADKRAVASEMKACADQLLLEVPRREQAAVQAAAQQQESGEVDSIAVSDKPTEAEATKEAATKDEEVDGELQKKLEERPACKLERAEPMLEAAAGAWQQKARVRMPVAFNPFVAVTENRFSTFGISVDTASYTVLRQALQAGKLPDPEQVRTEEIVNAFDYGDEAPEQAMFRIVVEGAPAPFGAPGLTTLRIGVKGRRLGREEQRPAMLTFLIDTSGSMSEPDRIGRARTALRLLLDRLAPSDRIQLIAFDDHARLVLPPTPAREKQAVLAAFDHLQCNGSTNLEDGMRQAYAQAARAFVPGGENRVILISDGVANLGSDNAQDIVQQVTALRRQGVTCSIFGVGNGTYNDAMLADLASKGGGVYRFLDTEDEVRRVFVDDLAATLNTIARDVKIQVEWSPAAVLRYRQLGYESRALQAEQFRDDRVQAGEVGSGQSVTALYQLERLPSAIQLPLGTVHVRFRRMDNGMVEELSRSITAADLAPSLAAARPAFRLAVCAAAFAEVLRGNPAAGETRYEDVARLLRPVVLDMPLDTRVKELLSLVDAAAGVRGSEH